ncbi:SDR family oxidoreductase [Euzebya tangerina]|uniref:SDR family oxidoreductase n=1 Tax=Euzebya tangerina TaxID=591198 RepID=UPI000E31D3AE|nr:NAD(P)H-binding protein [Euzebya tangerina]
MPVMVTGVEDVVGRRAVDQLLAGGGEVRVFIQAAAPEAGPAEQARVHELREDLRASRCKVAHGFLDDEAHVETALEQVHTVLHLLGRPGDDPDTYVEQTATVVGAAIGAGCKRLVLLSDLAVTDPAGHPWLEALAEAEDMAADAPLESVILRAALTVDPADRLTRALAGTAEGTLPEEGEHWPIPAGAVAATAVMADAERDVDTSLHVVVPLAGPDQVRTRDLSVYATSVVEGGAAGSEAEGLPNVGAGSPAPHADRLLDPEVRSLLARVVGRPEDAIGTQIAGSS